MTRRRRVAEPEFLPLDEVLAIHAHLIRTYGGLAGVRDAGALESALGMPRATFDGKLLHETIFEQAGAYLFHIARNHPFVDGNKRTALACALVFLRYNEWRFSAPEDEIVRFTLTVADGSASKADCATWLKVHSLQA